MIVYKYNVLPRNHSVGEISSNYSKPVISKSSCQMEINVIIKKKKNQRESFLSPFSIWFHSAHHFLSRLQLLLSNCFQRELVEWIKVQRSTIILKLTSLEPIKQFQAWENIAEVNGMDNFIEFVLNGCTPALFVKYL